MYIYMYRDLSSVLYGETHSLNICVKTPSESRIEPLPLLALHVTHRNDLELLNPVLALVQKHPAKSGLKQKWNGLTTLHQKN